MPAPLDLENPKKHLHLPASHSPRLLHGVMTRVPSLVIPPWSPNLPSPCFNVSATPAGVPAESNVTGDAVDATLNPGRLPPSYANVMAVDTPSASQNVPPGDPYRFTTTPCTASNADSRAAIVAASSSCKMRSVVSSLSCPTRTTHNTRR